MLGTHWIPQEYTMNTPRIHPDYICEHNMSAWNNAQWMCRDYIVHEQRTRNANILNTYRRRDGYKTITSKTHHEYTMRGECKHRVCIIITQWLPADCILISYGAHGESIINTRWTHNAYTMRQSIMQWIMNGCILKTKWIHLAHIINTLWVYREHYLDAKWMRH